MAVKEVIRKWTPVMGDIEARHPAWREDQLTLRAKNWSKKVAKAGFPAPTFTVVTDGRIEHTPYPYDRTYKVQAVKLAYSGVISVKLGDDVLVGSVDLTHSEPVWALSPKEELTPKERKSVAAHAGECSVCKSRRERKSTLLFRTPKNKITQIGRNCAAKVFGLALDPFGFMELTRDSEWNDGEEGGFRRHLTYDFAETAAVTAGIIDTSGWVSRGAVQQGRANVSTSEEVAAYFALLHGPKVQDREKKLATYMKGGEPSDAQRKLGQDAHEWARGLAAIGNDYEHKLRVLATDGWASPRDLGVVCSVVVAYRKAMGLLEERKSLAGSVWIAAVGDKLGLKAKGSLLPAAKGKVTAVIPTEFSDLVKVVTAEGNVVAAFMHAAGVRAGDDVTIAGTVKKLNEWRGIKETVLTRAKFV